jgi:hypothetical protein
MSEELSEKKRCEASTISNLCRHNIIYDPIERNIICNLQSESITNTCYYTYPCFRISTEIFFPRANRWTNEIEDTKSVDVYDGVLSGEVATADELREFKLKSS